MTENYLDIRILRNNFGEDIITLIKSETPDTYVLYRPYTYSIDIDTEDSSSNELHMYRWLPICIKSEEIELNKSEFKFNWKKEDILEEFIDYYIELIGYGDDQDEEEPKDNVINIKNGKRFH